MSFIRGIRPLALSRVPARVSGFFVVVIAMVVLAASAMVGCHHPAAVAAKEDAAVPFTVRDDSQGLLLTWIDEKGDFHVEQKVADVPLIGRDAVRAVEPGARGRGKRRDGLRRRSPRCEP